MTMDIIKIILSVFLLSTGRADTTGTDCPSNTVEIVFTKNGVICATTSSVPELNHLSVDPKYIPNLLGEPPIVQKMSLPVLTHPIISAPPPPQHLILQQMPFPHMSPELQMLGQPIPAQRMLVQPSAVDFMVRRLPLYHENTINQNLDYIDRRPDLMEDKRLYYQKMLWEKLRRDAFIKKLVRSNPNQLFGVQYIDDNNNNNNLNNDLPEKTTEEQSQNSQQYQQNIQTIDENTEQEERPAQEQSSQELQTFDEQSNSDDNHNNNNNDYNDNQNQEPIGLDEKTDEKEQILKDYLKHLNKEDGSPQEEQKTELQRDSRQYNMGSPATNSRVPDIIRGYMPEAPISTNGHTFGMKIQKTPEYSSDEPEVSQSQVSYQFVRPDSPQYNQNLMQSLRFPQNEDTDKSLRLVSTGMSFGHRVSPTEQSPEHTNFGYGFKSYPEYNEEKAKKFRAQRKFVVQPFVKEPVREPTEEDVVLVTADPNQRQIIETLEAQNSRRNQRKFSDDWTGSQGLSKNNAIDYKMNKDFRLDERRIEYNGWRPLRIQSRQSDQPEDKPKEEEELVKSSSSPKVISILPITGRVNNKWTAI